jgi:hypothetical protein
MYNFIKSAATAAGFPVSGGDEIRHTDLQHLRDYCFRYGVNIGEEFHKFKDVVDAKFAGIAPGTDIAAPEVVEAVTAEEIAPVSEEKAADVVEDADEEELSGEEFDAEMSDEEGEE